MPTNELLQSLEFTIVVSFYTFSCLSANYHHGPVSGTKCTRFSPSWSAVASLSLSALLRDIVAFHNCGGREGAQRQLLAVSSTWRDDILPPHTSESIPLSADREVLICCYRERYLRRKYWDLLGCLELASLEQIHIVFCVRVKWKIFLRLWSCGTSYWGFISREVLIVGLPILEESLKAIIYSRVKLPSKTAFWIWILRPSWQRCWSVFHPWHWWLPVHSSIPLILGPPHLPGSRLQLARDKM